jgi:adenine-specific DNA-methyltransferase
MPRPPSKPKTKLAIVDLTHPEATRKNIPTAEHQSVMQRHEQAPVRVSYPRGGGALPRMNAAPRMAEDLKNTGKGHLFVIFGEPDVDVLDAKGHSIRHYDGKRDIITLSAGEELVVKIGVDVFNPGTSEVRSDGADGIACWFIDTDYNEESFFVRHAYFLGANDPYKSLKTTLRAEIDVDAWATLNSDTSRPFPKPSTGRFAVKVINHLGDEVMKVFRVS